MTRYLLPLTDQEAWEVGQMRLYPYDKGSFTPVPAPDDVAAAVGREYEKRYLPVNKVLTEKDSAYWVEGTKPEGLFPTLPTYTAKSVRFDGATLLRNAALTAADSAKWSFSMWLMTDPVPNPDPTYYGLTCLLQHGDNTLAVGGVPPLGDRPNFFEVDMYDAAGDVGIYTGTAGHREFPSWTHILFSLDATEFPYKRKIYVNGLDVTADLDTDATSAPFIGTFSAVQAVVGGLHAGSGNLFFKGKMADVWDAPGVSLLDADGNIPEATRRLFTDALGRPKDPAGFPAAATIMTGDASTFGTNIGTGGAYTLTGTLHDGSSAPGQPYVPKAVHFDGSGGPPCLATAALIAEDSTKLSLSAWVSLDDWTGTFHNHPIVSMCNDNVSTYIGLVSTSILFYESDAYSPGANSYYGMYPPGYTTKRWVHVFYTADLSTPWKRKLYIDGQHTAYDQGSDGIDIPILMPFNGTPANIAGGAQLVGSLADVWVAPGVCLLDANGNLPEAELRRFITAEGRPVDPATFPLAAMLFTGGLTEFPVNRGTGGPFVLTTVLTEVPGPPEYVAKAVTFNGVGHLRNDSVATVDTPYFNYSVWVNVTEDLVNYGPTIFAQPAEGSYWTALFFTAVTGGVRAIGYVYGDVGSGSHGWAYVTGPVMQYGTWAHLLFASDSSGVAPVFKLYVDDVDQALAPQYAAGLPFIAVLNGYSLVVGTDDINDGGEFMGAAADFWIGNQNLLVTGDIPLATRRKFIDANKKPVDPVHFPPGLVLLSGDSGAFRTNRGTGGPFEVIGNLGDAAYGPSDYMPYAVRFPTDGTTHLDIAALTTPSDNGVYSWSFWWKPDPITDPLGYYASYIIAHSSYNGVYAQYFPPNGGAVYVAGEVWDPTDPTNGISDQTLTQPFQPGVWNHVLGSIDSSAYPPAAVVYVNDVDVTNLFTQELAGPLIGKFNGEPASLGATPGQFGIRGSIADLWSAPGQYLMDYGAGYSPDGKYTIPVEYRRRFITADGRAVDPRARNGEGAMAFSGKAADFPTNKGTGGAFTLTGTLTDDPDTPIVPR